MSSFVYPLSTQCTLSSLSLISTLLFSLKLNYHFFSFLLTFLQFCCHLSVSKHWRMQREKRMWDWHRCARSESDYVEIDKVLWQRRKNQQRLYGMAETNVYQSNGELKSEWNHTQSRAHLPKIKVKGRDTLNIQEMDIQHRCANNHYYSANNPVSSKENLFCSLYPGIWTIIQNKLMN